MFLCNITFSSNDIRKIIQNLDSEKARSYDERIIIGMFKICGPSICTLFEIIFKCLESGIFQLEWKNVKGETVQKKKLQITSSKIPVDLNISIFKLLLYSKMFDFLMINHLIFINHAG